MDQPELQRHRDAVWDAVLQTISIYAGIGARPDLATIKLQFECMKQNDRYLHIPLLLTPEQVRARSEALAQSKEVRT